MLLYVILLLLFHANVCDSSPPNASRILNTTRIFPLSSLVSFLSPNVSRDAPYILQLPSEHGSQLYKAFWVFSDTETFNAKGHQTGFVSNSAGWDSSDREAILDVVLMGKNSNLALRVTDVLVSTEGTIREQWIPYTKEELSFNDVNKKGSKKRIALWPNCPPTAVNESHAFLYCTIIEVTPPPPPSILGQKDSHVGWLYMFKGITLVSIARENNMNANFSASIRPSRTVPKLFTDNEVSWGNFGALVGQCPLAVRNNDKQNGTCVYPIAIGARGLMLASVPLDQFTDKRNYMFFDPSSASFGLESPMHTSATATFLNGTFSSGNIFFSDLYQTFLIVYFNRLVDNSFYIRYLDRERPLHLLKGAMLKDDSTWVINRNLTANDVEAIVRYAWSGQYKLYETEQGKGGFSYAGSVGVNYFAGLDGTKGKSDKTNWVLLTWTEQTGEKIQYTTRGAVLGFTKNKASDATIKEYNISNMAWDYGEEAEVLNSTFKAFPWDGIYTRVEMDNKNLKSEGGRSFDFSKKFLMKMVGPIAVYVIEIATGLFLFLN